MKLIKRLRLFIKKVSSQARLRRQMQKILHGICDGYEWEKSRGIWDFIDWLEQHRTFKKLVFIPKAMPPFLHGAWLTSDSKEYIFYDSEALPGHKDHIILHEVCHILLNHKTKYVTEEEGDFLAQQPTTCPQVAEFLLLLAANRQTCKIFNQQEEQVETLAQLIQKKMIFLSNSSSKNYYYFDTVNFI